MSKKLRARRLAVEPMENRLLLSGTQLIDVAIFNQDPVDSSQYAVISADQDLNLTASFADRADIGKLYDAAAGSNWGEYQFYSTNGNISSDSTVTGGQLRSDLSLAVGDILITQPWTPPLTPLTTPTLQNVFPAGSVVRNSIGIDLRYGESFDYPPIDVSPVDPKTDGGSIVISTGGKDSGFGSDLTSTHQPQVILTEPTTTGPVASHETTTPISNEGGMIAVSDVLASLQREGATLGSSDTRVAAHRRAVGNELEASAGATVTDNRLSGELARAVSFEMMDGQAADGAEHTKVDDGLSTNGNLPIEATGEKLALASEGGRISFAASGSGTNSAPNSTRHDQVATVADGILPVHLASYVRSKDAAANEGEVGNASANVSDHALIEAVAVPTDNLQSDPRGEVFSRWSRRDSLLSRRDNDRHGLPWDMAPVLIVLGLERYLAAKRHSEDDDDSRPATRRENLSAR